MAKSLPFNTNNLRAKVFNKSIELRGLILEGTVSLERGIDEYLSQYFCKDDATRNEIKEMLWCTERITLSSKKDIFFILLNRHNKDFLIKHPSFIKTLDELVPHRNIFAHLEVDYSDEAVSIEDFGIQFKKFKNGKLQHKRYTTKDIESLNIKFNEVREGINELLKTD